MKTGGKLIAVLALSQKLPQGCYSLDDIDMLMSLADQAAVTFENARLYDTAEKQLKTDETGLFNRRYFSERLDEEIARSTRFGNIFSFIFLRADKSEKQGGLPEHMSGDIAVRSHLSNISRETKYW